MSFTILVVLCIAGGIAFAGIAAWLTTKKGNTISDVLNSQNMKDAEAIKIEILNKISLRSSIPIVGLYVVAAVVAIGLPAYVYYMNRSGDAPIMLQGRLENIARGDNIFITPAEMRVQPGGVFRIPLMYRSGSQMVNIESLKYNPLTLTIVMNKDSNTVTVSFSNDISRQEHLKVDDATRTAALEQGLRLLESPLEPLAAVVNKPMAMSGSAAVHTADLLADETTAAAALMAPTGGNP